MKLSTLAIASTVVCTAASLGTGSVLAQDFTSSSPMDQLSELVGDGVCTGTVMAMGKKPSHATTGKYHGEKTLDGHWVVLRYDEDKSAAVAKPFSVVQYFGYDAARKRFVSVLVDNSGESYSTGTSAAWKNDSIVFDETTNGKTNFRDAFTSSQPGMKSHTGWMKDEHGKWVKTDHEDCKPS